MPATYRQSQEPVRAPKVPFAPYPRRAPLSRPQTGWLLLILVSALVALGVGLSYLSAHARMTAEGYRRDKLTRLRKNQREKVRQLKQQLAIANTTATIEQEARKLGMIRADEQQTIFLR